MWRRQSAGRSSSLVACRALNREPISARRLNPGLPQDLERILAKCLEKDRRLRYQHASDLRADLQRMQRDPLSGRTTDVERERRPTLARYRPMWLSVGAAILVAAIAGAVYSRRPATLTDRDTIVLADFTNSTGDPVFDDTLRQGLAVQLQQSPFLSLVSDERIRRTLTLMNQPADARCREGERRLRRSLHALAECRPGPWRPRASPGGVRQVALSDTRSADPARSGTRSSPWQELGEAHEAAVQHGQFRERSSSA